MTSLDTIYFNTTNLSSWELRDAFEQAAKQEEQILLIFKHTPQRYEIGWTRDEMQKNSFPNTPDHSLSRAFSNLTDAGYLVKSEKTKRMGKYGKMVHAWRLKPQDEPKEVQAELWGDRTYDEMFGAEIAASKIRLAKEQIKLAKEGWPIHNDSVYTIYADQATEGVARNSQGRR